MSAEGDRSHIGVDLGGTKIEAIALAADGAEIFRRRRATPKSYEGTLQAVAALVSEADAAAAARCSVGIGIPGTISPATGLVKNANSTWLIGHPLDRDLARLVDRPVRVMNDANCFALSEATDGAGAGAGVVFGVIIGTGVGGGIVAHGRVIVGPQGIAGEWGHNPLPGPDDSERPGPDCYCGRRGCVETFLSGPAMEADHRRVSGEDLSTREIVARATGGDAAAAATLERYAERLGRALATVGNLLDPDVIVLGGGMSNLPDLAARCARALHPHLFTDHPTTPVRRNRHGDSSGVRGAAWLGAGT